MNKSIKLTRIALTVVASLASTNIVWANASHFDCDNITPIYDIQGSEYSSPLVLKGQYESATNVTTQGIVTKISNQLGQGFYIQDENGDGNPNTSDGLFVYLGAKVPDEIKLGDLVCVSGKIKEHYGLTQMDLSHHSANYRILDSHLSIPPFQLIIEDGESLSHALERYEGMKVILVPDSNMVLSRNFSFNFNDHRANLALSHQAPLMHPTQLYHALTPQAMSLAKSNQVNQLVVDSDPKSTHSLIPYFPDFNPETGYLRIGDKLNNLQGVITYDHNSYRLIPTNQISAGDIYHTMDRNQAPGRSVNTDIRVASFNVLNFFNEVETGATNPLNTNRGAKTEEDFVLQKAKIANAISEMDADIVGLMEVENNGFGSDSAIKSLTDGINDKFNDPDQYYQYVKIASRDRVDGKYFGHDAITVGMLYRPSKVELNADAFVIKTPEQHVPANTETRFNPKNQTTEFYPANKAAHQRWSLAQSFIVKSSGDKLTVVVNHLKSKGSDCLEDWKVFEGRDEKAPIDLQGHCVEFRLSAIKVLGESLKSVQGDVLFIGDMNSYSMEDPIWALTDYKAGDSVRPLYTASYTSIDGEPYENKATPIKQGFGYLNLSELPQVRALHQNDLVFSYSFGGELGSLDHALGNKSLANRVENVTDWHINSAESDQFEYGHKFGSQLEKLDNPFSATDHDPVMIDLNYSQAINQTMPTLPIKNESAASKILSSPLMDFLGWLNS